VKHVDLPENMKRVMARQAESERERRAKVIHAEGEFQAAAKLRDAAETLKDHPMALQLRYLQTLSEVGGGTNNTTNAFPVPIDLFGQFLRHGGSPDGFAHPEDENVPFPRGSR
jgi:regulator of protease activity HflC (stomatin/prohibitin superfamily)